MRYKGTGAWGWYGPSNYRTANHGEVDDAQAEEEMREELLSVERACMAGL